MGTRLAIFKLSVALAIIAILVMPDNSKADVWTETSLIRQDEVLQGLRGATELSVTLGPQTDRSKTSEVALIVKHSDRLDLKRSYLQLEVNGQSRKIVSLSQAQAGKVVLPLGVLKQGNNKITLRSKLRPLEEDCLSGEDPETWLRIEETSKLRVFALKKEGPSKTISAYPDAWTRRPSGPSNIVLSTNRLSSNLSKLAYLEANHLLRYWGFAPTVVRDSATVGALVLRQADANLGKGQSSVQFSRAERAQIALHAHKDARFVILVEEEHTIVIYGKDDEGLRQGVGFLFDIRARSLCSKEYCLGGSLATLLPDRSSIKPVVNDKSREATFRAWELKQSGFPNGWLAEGQGTKTFEFNWIKPAGWAISDWPLLRLFGRLSLAPSLDAARSVINIKLNGQPLASYALDQWKAASAAIRVPQEQWSAPVWSFEVQVTLRPLSKNKCDFDESKSLWFLTGAETRLEVPHFEIKNHRISGFFNRHRLAGTLPVLSFDLLEAGNLPGLALLTYPFMRSAIEAGVIEKKWPRWVHGTADVCRSSSCFWVRKEVPADSPLQFRQDFWMSAKPNVVLPLVAGKESVVLLSESEGTDQAKHMLWVLPSSSGLADNLTLAEPPDYRSLPGNGAIFVSPSWHSVDDLIAGDPNKAARDRLDKEAINTRNSSTEQSKLRWLNFIWAILSIFVIGALSYRLWRNPKGKKADDNWEVH